MQFEDANYQSSLNKPFMMAPGNRVDLLVQAPTTPAIYPVVVQPAVDPSDLKSAYPVTLVSVRIKADRSARDRATVAVHPDGAEAAGFPR